MKQSTTLVALVTLVLAIMWGCSGGSDGATPGSSNTNNATVTGTNTGTVTGTGNTATTTTGTSTTGGLSCVAPQADCGGSCVNTMTSAIHCGGCGMACGIGEACNAGVCGCAGGGVACDGACVDTMTDPNNCGGCGMACGTGAACQGGACVCQTGFTDCSGTCVNTMEDVNNCGACATACGTQVCSLGACSDSCAEGLENCTGSCVDTMTSTGNCGGCDMACGAGLSCAAGACACPTGETTCNGQCVNTMTNAMNCGACGTACPTGATCTAGACACPDGQELCGTECVAAGTPCNVTTSPCATNANSLMLSDFEGDPTTVALAVVNEAEGINGLWENFNDETSTQTFAVEVDDAADTQCGQALHTTGSGFSDWGVGIGFSFAGTPEAPTVYDGSEWTGIRFKAKKGSGGLTPVRFNISVPPTEGVDSGGTCDPASNADCYNHPGRFLEGSYEVGAEWRTYHLCFDRDLYPQFLPSALTNAQRESVSSNLLKVQFIFNKAIDPSKNVEEDPNGGLYDLGSEFDFWLDDVELTKDACPESLFEGTGNKAFPQNKAPGSCELAPNVGVFSTALSEYYEEWKTRFLKSDGSVFSPEDNRTISEGMGYGMLLAVSFGDKAAFDSMWGYVSANLCGGLMTWIGGGGCQGSATDADADIAYALLLAGDQWGGTYEASGNSMIGVMGTEDISSGRINAGSNWGENNPDAFNPSYFTPAYYDEFGGSWASSYISSGYGVLSSCEEGFLNGDNNRNGLVPDWCSASSGNRLNGEQTADVTSTLCDSTCDHYAYDAARVPWRIGVDACLSNRSEATAYLGRLIGHFDSLYPDRIDTMLSGFRSSDGTAHANAVEMQASFIGPVGVGAMSVNQEVYERAFRAVLDILRDTRFNRTYYPTTVGLITLLEMSGNIPHR